MHVGNASRFLASTQHTLVAGDTLVFDFVFFLHPVSQLAGRAWPAPARQAQRRWERAQAAVAANRRGSNAACRPRCAVAGF